jgi:hypothetical protein
MDMACATSSDSPVIASANLPSVALRISNAFMLLSFDFVCAIALSSDFRRFSVSHFDGSSQR